MTLASPKKGLGKRFLEALFAWEAAISGKWASGAHKRLMKV
jgi:hypothetical protein